MPQSLRVHLSGLQVARHCTHEVAPPHPPTSPPPHPSPPFAGLDKEIATQAARYCAQDPATAMFMGYGPGVPTSSAWALGESMALRAVKDSGVSKKPPVTEDVVMAKMRKHMRMRNLQIRQRPSGTGNNKHVEGAMLWEQT